MTIHHLLISALLCLFSATSIEAQIPRFTFVGTPQELTQYATLSLCDDGTLVVADGYGKAYALDARSDAFTPIPGNAPVTGGQINEEQRWYHRNGNWLAVTRYALSLSDSTGLVEATRSNTIQWSSFTWNDSVFIRRMTIGPDTTIETAVWLPGTTSMTFDTVLGRRLRTVHDEQILSNGTIWLGGHTDRWWITSTGQPENADSGLVNNRYCPGILQPALVNERDDSLIVLMRNGPGDFFFGKCYIVLALPMSDLRTYRVVQITLPDGFDRQIYRGHDQHGVGILKQGKDASDPKPDLLYILSPDMQSHSVQPFLGIDELTVLDLEYDPDLRVYYALTTRGLYRSDRVTSVASDDQRPASDVPRQTTWYNTLGELVASPTRPGLYLKMVIDDKGRMVTEKVAIP